MMIFLAWLEELILIPWVFGTALFLCVFIGICALNRPNATDVTNAYSTGGLFFLIAIFGLLCTRFLLHTPFHYWYCLVFAVAYLMVGVVWSTYKWFLYVRDLRNNFVVEVTMWVNSHDEMTPEKFRLWDLSSEDRKDFFWRMRNKVRSFDDRDDADSYQDVLRKFTPQVSKCKPIVFEWISLWPLSVTDYIWNRLFRDWMEFIFNCIKGMFQRMANKVFSDDIL